MLGDCLYLDNVREFVEDENRIVRLSCVITSSHPYDLKGLIQVAQQKIGSTSRCSKEVSVSSVYPSGV